MERTEKIYRIESCSFKRLEDNEYEPGLLLNEGELGILDAFGKIVGECWTWIRETELVIQTDFLDRTSYPQKVEIIWIGDSPDEKRVEEFSVGDSREVGSTLVSKETVESIKASRHPF